MKDNRTSTGRQTAIFLAGVAELQLRHLAIRVALETHTADADSAIVATGIQFDLLRARDVVQCGIATANSTRVVPIPVQTVAGGGVTL